MLPAPPAADAGLLDETDLDLVAALQVAPRAPVNALAEAVDSSPSTIARRLARLRGDGLLRVVGRLDWPLITTENPRLLWIRCAPGRSQEVAERIAELEEVQTLLITTGSADIYCTVYPLLGSDIFDLLTRRLPGLPGIVSTQSMLVLRTQSMGQSWRLHRLPPDREAALAGYGDQVRQAPPAGLHELNAAELRTLELLAGDGRISAAEVARELQVSRSAAYRMTQSLLESGAVWPRVEIEPAALGYPLNALMALTVRPHAIPDVLARLAGHPSARYVAMVAGSSSVIHYGVFRDEQDLARFTTDDLGASADITALDTCVALRVVRRYWMARDGARLGERLPGFPGRLLRA
ncbi:Lrp/AsnC family transcriptional regulator [Nocardiopsis mangrovi]|uniref:Lrp/AsnC family transcriptional regulator n=1 Tax=Nocardiopsis mangrovi TaxID=1179818 RepID=A0ABV9E6U8_9ACTN